MLVFQEIAWKLLDEYREQHQNRLFAGGLNLGRFPALRAGEPQPLALHATHQGRAQSSRRLHAARSLLSKNWKHATWGGATGASCRYQTTGTYCEGDTDLVLRSASASTTQGPCFVATLQTHVQCNVLQFLPLSPRHRLCSTQHCVW